MFYLGVAHNLSGDSKTALSYFNKVKFIGKTKVILFGLVKEDVLSASHTLKSKRPINIFTGRGVRFAKQIVYKKQGKVSSYR